MISSSATTPPKSAVSSSSQLLNSPDRASVLQAVQRSQTTMAEQATKEQWRLAFNREAFGIDPTVKDGPTPKTGRTSKTLTRKEWEERVHILSSWGDPAEKGAELPPSVAQFRRAHTKGYHLALNFFLVPYGQGRGRLSSFTPMVIGNHETNGNRLPALWSMPKKFLTFSIT